MTKLKGPRHGSPAHKAICRIVDLGGCARMSQLLSVIPVEYHQINLFRKHVLEPLSDYALIYTVTGKETDVLKATPVGKDFAGRFVMSMLPTATKFVGEIAPARTRAVRELNVDKHRAVAPYRPGSDEYKQIPSLYTSAVVKQAEVNEHGAIIHTTTVGHVIRKLPDGKVVA